MGCCCLKPGSQNYQIPNTSDIVVVEQQKIPLDLIMKYREQGKKFFNMKDYHNAIKAFQLAVQNDPQNLVNYTNLSLAQKCSHQFQQSIDTINKMEAIKNQKCYKEQLKFIVKGKIIKARCQTILAKNYCLSNAGNREKINYAETMINQAINELIILNEQKQYQQFVQKFQLAKYLENAKKIKNILIKIQKNQPNEQQLLNYVKKQVTSDLGKSEFRRLELDRLFTCYDNLLDSFKLWMKEKQQKNLVQDQQQIQFIIDPIIYQQFVNPILIRSGLTYQQSTLRSHYQKNGSYDPITRQQLNNQFGVVNRTLIAYISQTKKNYVKNQLDILDL